MYQNGKIELKAPYKDLYRFAYIVTNKEPRRNVILYNSHTDRTTISLARYLYETHTGVFLEKDKVVDHIDGNQMNDVLSNYQVLTVKENNVKARKQSRTTRQLVRFECGSCGKVFVRSRNHTHLVVESRGSTYCSRSCAGKRLKPSLEIEQFRE